MYVLFCFANWKVSGKTPEPEPNRHNMKRTFSRVLIIMAIVILNSLLMSAQSQQKSSFFEYKPLRENGKINSDIKGYWKSIGNGYILSATNDSILLYSYTSHFCYKE